MKSSDLDDDAVLDAVRACNEGRCSYPMDAGYHGGNPGYGFAPGKHEGHWANRWDLARLFPEVPEKVLLAKLRRLIQRKKLDGCACGCRGGFEIPAHPIPEKEREA